MLDFYRSFAVGVASAAPKRLASVLTGLRRAQAHEATANGAVGWLGFGMIRLILLPFLQAGSSQLLAVAAFVNEGRFQSSDLAVQQKVCLVDQADQRIGADSRVFVVKPRGVELPALGVREIRQIYRMGPIRLIFFEGAWHSPHGLCLRAFHVPKRKPAMAQEVFVIQQQLLQAGSRNVHKAQFCLRRSCGRATALRDVLPATACRLHHLIDRARARVKKCFTEPIRSIIDHGSSLETRRIPVAATRPEFLSTFHDERVEGSVRSVGFD